MKYFIFLICLISNYSFTKNMKEQTTIYSFSTEAINNLGFSITQCDSFALNDPETEWICANYNKGFEAFKKSWFVFEKSQNHKLKPKSDWLIFNNADGSLDFYGKTYYLNKNQLLVAFDPSETGREIFIGSSPQIFSIMANAENHSKTLKNTDMIKPNIYGVYNCDSFKNQTDAIKFFKSNGFNKSYDPYNLDANNNGIPCEVNSNTSKHSQYCSNNEYWVSAFVRKDGVRVKGHCRKKR